MQLIFAYKISVSKGRYITRKFQIEWYENGHETIYAQLHGRHPMPVASLICNGFKYNVTELVGQNVQLKEKQEKLCKKRGAYLSNWMQQLGVLG